MCLWVTPNTHTQLYTLSIQHNTLNNSLWAGLEKYEILKAFIPRAGKMRNINKTFWKNYGYPVVKGRSRTLNSPSFFFFFFLDISLFYISFYLFNRWFYPKQFTIKRGSKSSSWDLRAFLKGSTVVTWHGWDFNSQPPVQIFQKIPVWLPISHHIIYLVFFKNWREGLENKLSIRPSAWWH